MVGQAFQQVGEIGFEFIDLVGYIELGVVEEIDLDIGVVYHFLEKFVVPFIGFEVFASAVIVFVEIGFGDIEEAGCFGFFKELGTGVWGYGEELVGVGPEFAGEGKGALDLFDGFVGEANHPVEVDMEFFFFHYFYDFPDLIEVEVFIDLFLHGWAAGFNGEADELPGTVDLDEEVDDLFVHMFDGVVRGGEFEIEVLVHCAVQEFDEPFFPEPEVIVVEVKGMDIVFFPCPGHFVEEVIDGFVPDFFPP